MPKYTVYLDDAQDREVRAAANATGSTFTEVIRKRLQASSTNQKIKRVEDKLDALFGLFELVIGDVGYVAGATRAGTKNHEAATKEGAYFEAQFRRSAAAAKRVFHSGENAEGRLP